MRIALLGLFPAQPTYVRGGVEAVVATLAYELAEQPGTEIHVITNAIEKTSQTEQRGKITVHRLPEQRLGRLTLFRADRQRIVEKIRVIAPDVCHAHGSGTHVAAALASRVPTVVTVHGIVAAEARVNASTRSMDARLRWQFDRWYEKMCLSQTREIIAISPYVLQALPNLNQRARVTLIENPIDATFFEITRAPSPGVIFCPARVIARKGILELIHAFARVHKVLSSATLRIAGETDAEPDYFAQCQATANVLGVGEHVQFLNSLSTSALREELATCSVVALASRQETAPVALEEALAAGCAVVATAVGGVPGLIRQNETGLLVPVGNAEIMANQLLAILQDAELAEKLGSAGKIDAMARFHPTAVAQKTRRVYENLLANEAKS